MTQSGEPGRRLSPISALTILFLSNVLNVADRLLLGIVTDPVRRDLLLSDTQMSIVNGAAFVIFNLLVGIVVAGWVDRGNRKFILAGGVALWSLSTALTGLAQDFWSLATFRILVGVGEATAFPVALSMIGDYFAAQRRPRAVAIFQSSNFVGVVLGSIAAGVLAAAHGWREMFIICGAAGGVVLVIIVMGLREPPRSLNDAGATAAAPNLGASLTEVLASPGFIPLALGFALSGMMVAVLPAWAPTFLLRSHHVSLEAVGAVIGPAVGLGGITGTIVAGALGSYLVQKRGRQSSALLVPLFALPLAPLFFALFLFAPSLNVAMLGTATMNFLLASALGPCLAVAIGITRPTTRGVTSTLVLFAQGLIGSALAPFIVGVLSDYLTPALGEESLRYALTPMLAAPVLASICLLVAWRIVRAQTSDKTGEPPPTSETSARPSVVLSRQH